jgi:hypothetical protein
LLHLTFTDIAKVIGSDLPASAFRHRAWWGNGGHDYAHAWLDAGWFVDKVNFVEGLVTLKRKKISSPRIISRTKQHYHHDLAKSKTIILVSCVKKKALSAKPARYLYLSSWFKKASHYAEKSGLVWFILSAKYGLVEPDKIIDPYNQTLNMMKKSERLDWSNRVMASLRPHIAPGMQIVIFAGRYYRTELIPQLTRMGCMIDVPLKHMRIGEQMRWFNEHL